MDAIISGQAAQAVITERGKHFLLALDSDDSMQHAIPEHDVPRVFLDCTDVYYLREATLEQIKNELEAAWARDRALHLTLILLDSHEDAENRLLAADCLHDLFLDDRVKLHVMYFLYAAPLPQSCDLDASCRIAETNGYERVLQFLSDLVADQPEIRRRCDAWDRLPLHLLGSESNKEWLKGTFIKHGAFWMFVTEKSRKDSALLSLLVNERIRGINNARIILQEWYAPFHEHIRSTSFKGWDRLEDDKYDAIDDEVRPRSSKRGREVLENVQKQKEAIKDLLTKGERLKAWKYTRQLVESQRSNSEPAHIAKSLCDIAQHAKLLGDISLHLRFSSWAAKEMPTDSWAYAQVGDAYRLLHDFEKALDAFQKCGAFGDDRIALSGRAEVLKDSGAFNEALDVYKKAAEIYQDDSVPRNGIASTLAAYGRLEEALHVYNEIAKTFPSDRVTLCGRAQVLRDMGRINEALQAVESISSTLGADSVSACIRAGILRDQNELDKAASIYRDVIKADPLNMHAYQGLGQTLKFLGRFDEAIDVFETAIWQFREDAGGYLGRAGVYKCLGDLTSALADYEHVIRKSFKNLIARNGKASILAARGEFQTAIDLLPDHAPSTQSEWVSYHIMGMINLKRGQVRQAMNMFEYGVTNIPWYDERQFYQTALTVALMKEGKFEDASVLLDIEATPALLPVVKILKMHVYGELNDENIVRVNYDDLRENAPQFNAGPREELFRYYLSGVARGRYMNHDAIIQQECNAILLAA